MRQPRRSDRAGIYDLIEQHQRQAAESALDRLIDIDLEYVNQMNELRLLATCGCSSKW